MSEKTSKAIEEIVELTKQLWGEFYTFTLYTEDEIKKIISDKIKMLLSDEKEGEEVQFTKSKMDGRDVPYCGKCDLVLCYDESIEKCKNCGTSLTWPKGGENGLG